MSAGELTTKDRNQVACCTERKRLRVWALWAGLFNTRPKALVISAFGAASWYVLMSPAMATTIVAAIIVHEAGHIAAARIYGRRVKGMILIPFLGGVVQIKPPKSAAYNVVITAAGPFIGAALILPLLVVGFALDSKTCLQLAGFVAWINLMNMAPMLPLDGGRVTLEIIGNKYAVFGIAILFSSSTLWLGAPAIFNVVLVFSTLSFMTGMKPARHRLSSRDRIIVAAVWIVFGVLLWIVTLLFGRGPNVVV